eukprot:CAMPEP_0118949058 /NCGR_PEP_ID=MMETSP1169-20130426/48951_1 /TAXON_ID=36882 /ORGANISM="Pyramimonas obovata, Strain CCMP722" /LENGTH=267 /DNA_ID=CAMNT_0006895607 /DNA_START=120 /DNA_END=920 /DNA_ORIENTATION=+
MSSKKSKSKAPAASEWRFVDDQEFLNNIASADGGNRPSTQNNFVARAFILLTVLIVAVYIVDIEEMSVFGDRVVDQFKPTKPYWQSTEEIQERLTAEGQPFTEHQHQLGILNETGGTAAESATAAISVSVEPSPAASTEEAEPASTNESEAEPASTDEGEGEAEPTSSNADEAEPTSAEEGEAEPASEPEESAGAGEGTLAEEEPSSEGEASPSPAAHVPHVNEDAGEEPLEVPAQPAPEVSEEPAAEEEEEKAEREDKEEEEEEEG